MITALDKWPWLTKILVFLASLGIAAYPTYIALKFDQSYSLATMTVLIAAYSLLCFYAAFTIFIEAVGCEIAWNEVDSVERSCQTALVAITLFTGLFQFFRVELLKLPQGGFSLFLYGLVCLIVGVTPFGPRISGNQSQNLSLAVRQARLHRALKTIAFAGAALCLLLVALNIQRLNPNPIKGLPGFSSEIEKAENQLKAQK